MIQKDWADNQAEDLFDKVRDDQSDEEVTESIAVQLRLAFLAGGKAMRQQFRSLLDIQ